MTADSVEKASDSLRELARMVLRDGIDSEHLADYMHGLLANQLIEPNAICRFEAMGICQWHSRLSELDVAGHLYEVAVEIECGGPEADRSTLYRGQRAFGGSKEELLILLRKPRSRIVSLLRRAAWLRELAVAMLFATVAVALLPTEDCTNVTLRLIAVGVYGLFGVAAIAIYAAQQHAHSRR